MWQSMACQMEHAATEQSVGRHGPSGKWGLWDLGTLYQQTTCHQNGAVGHVWKSHARGR